MNRAVLLGLAICFAAAPVRADVALKDKWVYCSQNLLPAQNIPPLLALMERAKKAGYTGILLADYKFNILDRMDRGYFANAQRVIDKAKELDLEIVPCVFSIGYADGVLAHDPSLAEGLPVVDAPFVVQGGKLVPLMDEGTKLLNGSFEELDAKGRLAGWWQENVGGSVFADRDVVKDGKLSLRMQDIRANSPEHGHCRVHQLVKTQPFRYYHLSVWIKTENFDTPGEVKLLALAKKPGTLSYKDLDVKRTQDWTQYHIVLNSLENTEVRIYLGVWGGKTGKLWWDGLTMEPAGFVNVIRRDGCPLKLTTADGKTALEEGRDVSRVIDPKLGNEKWMGTFAPWHTPPEVTVPAGSRLREGDRVLASYYHPMIIHGDQVACSLTDPKVYEILDDQMRRVHELFQAKRYMMSHDEIRVGGWTPDYAGKTMGQWLAINVRKCYDIAKKRAPGVGILVWSDMFDPNHNAVADYYLVKTTWAGSWEGLPKDVVMMDWYQSKAAQTFKFFGERGHEQMIAGYYDGDPDASARAWLAAAKASRARVTGIVYTTWRSDFSNLEKFIDAAEKYAR